MLKIETGDPSEPTNFLRYCPHCGSADFTAASFKDFRCGKCGFNFFVNSAAAVVAIILDDEGRILLTRRGREPFKDWLDLPGGFVDPGEAAEDALRREMKEELGIDVELVRFLCSHPNEYVFSKYKVRTTDLCFVCRMKQKPTSCADDVEAFEWLRPEDIDISKVAFSSIKKFVLAAIDIATQGQKM